MSRHLAHGASVPPGEPRLPLRWTGAPADLEHLVDALVSGDGPGSDRQALAMAGPGAGLDRLYLDVLGPAMYEVGRLWEQRRITVAQEHIATSLVTRIMSAAQVREEGRRVPGLTALVAAGPGELHHIGAWMVADLLESRGWDIRFPGAGASAEDLLAELEAHHPRLLALSITMPFNVPFARDLIGRARALPALSGLRVLVGGQVFLQSPDLAAAIGADGWADSPRSACHRAEAWCREATA